MALCLISVKFLVRENVLSVNIYQSNHEQTSLKNKAKQEI